MASDVLFPDSWPVTFHGGTPERGQKAGGSSRCHCHPSHLCKSSYNFAPQLRPYQVDQLGDTLPRWQLLRAGVSPPLNEAHNSNFPLDHRRTVWVTFSISEGGGITLSVNEERRGGKGNATRMRQG